MIGHAKYSICFAFISCCVCWRTQPNFTLPASVFCVMWLLDLGSAKIDIEMSTSLSDCMEFRFSSFNDWNVGGWIFLIFLFWDASNILKLARNIEICFEIMGVSKDPTQLLDLLDYISRLPYVTIVQGASCKWIFWGSPGFPEGMAILDVEACSCVTGESCDYAHLCSMFCWAWDDHGSFQVFEDKLLSNYI